MPLLIYLKQLNQMSKNYILIIFISVMITGCQSTFGPSAIQNTHPAYNQSIVNTLSQQMLLNLVRLKYRESPYFLKVSSITSALTFAGSLGIDAEADLGPGGNLIKPSFGVSYADRPTISYIPLQGEDFLKSVLSSISLDALLVMTQSGWSIERVFGISVERMNNLYNAPSASGPSPDIEPEYKRFKRMTSIFRTLQLQDSIELGTDIENDSKTENISIKLNLKKTNKELYKELTELLEIPYENKQSRELKITSNFLTHQKNELTIRTRSISGILYYLSQNIEVPEQHIKDGLVTVTKTKSQKLFDWSDTPAGNFFKIKSSEEFPENAYLAVPYRDYWYYISDNDLQSKSTFMLLNQLFGLQAGQTNFSGPTLTLPVR